jgi:hypothetical protein
MVFELWLPELKLRPLPLDHRSYVFVICTKLYFHRSQIKEQTTVVLNGTNIFLVGLYFYFLNFICGIWS